MTGLLPALAVALSTAVPALSQDAGLAVPPPAAVSLSSAPVQSATASGDGTAVAPEMDRPLPVLAGSGSSQYPVGVIPVGPGGRLLRWNIRPWVGASTIRLGGIEVIPKTSVAYKAPIWKSMYSASIVDQRHRNSNYAAVAGLSAGYQVSPMIELGAKFGYLRTESGYYVTEAEGGGYRLTDYWTDCLEALIVSATAGVKMPLTEKFRINADLSLGTSQVSVTITRRFREDPDRSLTEARADGRAWALIPELTMNFEYDLAPSLAAGFGLGYRFGGVSAFKHRHDTNLSLLTGTVENAEGDYLRDSSGFLVPVDLGGMVVVLSVTVRP